MTNTSATEQLLAAPLPKLIQDLGMAVATANAALPKGAGDDLVYTIDSAEIELKVALSISKDTEVGASGGLALSAFNVNASYSSTYGFKEEASSVIKLTLSCKPRSAAAANG